MRNLFVLAIAFLFVLTGCSSNSASDVNRVDGTDAVNNSSEYSESWNYKEGFVIAKQDGEVLVVRNEVSDIKAPLNELLQEAKPDAIWLSVDDASYEAVTVGDQVSIYIPNGMVDQSYPAQATAELYLKGQEFIGYVVNIEKDRILVVSPEAQDLSAAGGKKNFFYAIWFSNVPANIDIGMKVEVWTHRELMESYPPQGAAKHIAVMNGTKPEGAKRYEYEAVKEAILSVASDKETNFTVVTDVEYNAASSEWTVYIFNEEHDQVREISVPDKYPSNEADE